MIILTRLVSKEAMGCPCQEAQESCNRDTLPCPEYRWMLLLSSSSSFLPELRHGDLHLLCLGTSSSTWLPGLHVPPRDHKWVIMVIFVKMRSMMVMMAVVMMVMMAPRSPCTSSSPQVGHGGDNGQDKEYDGDDEENGDDGSQVSMYQRRKNQGSKVAMLPGKFL